MMVRRSIAAGAGLLVLIVLVFGVRGCLDSRKESAITDYVTDMSALVDESNQQSEALFALLEGTDGAGDVEIQNGLNSFRVQAAQLVDRARALGPPDELDATQGYLVETLDFRRDGVDAIADQLPAAITGDEQSEGAADDIAFDMRPLLASDQIYSRRVRPTLEQVLDQEGLGGQLKVPPSEFLPDVSWLQPAEVATRISELGGTASSDEEAAPGLHGNGIASVALGGQVLTPDGATSVTVSDDLAFQVTVANQGENTETDVKISITVGSGSDAIELEKVVDTIAAGESKPVDIPLGEQPPTGQNVPVKVDLELVPGEDPEVGNNEAEYTVIFTS